MTRLSLAGSGVIYRNPDPGHRYIATLFPHVLELQNGDFLCTYNRGSALYATDLDFYQMRSTDGGRTWQDEGIVFRRPADGQHYSYHNPFLNQMSDGTLLIGAFRADRSDPDQPMFNEATGGLLSVETILLCSTDNGHTWSAPEVVALPDNPVVSAATSVLELADGRWFWPFDQWKAFDDTTPYQPRTLGYFSDDQGRTWGDKIVYADGANEGKGFWHGMPIHLDDGRLLTLYWAADMTTGENITNYVCTSDASARGWTTPEPTNLPGQTNAVVDLGGGRLAVIYNVRESERPGVMATTSEDGGRTWDLDNALCLWDATGRDRLGVVSLDAYPRSHDTIAFGAPVAFRTSDGDVYAAWWCMEAALVHIRWARLSVDAGSDAA